MPRGIYKRTEYHIKRLKGANNSAWFKKGHNVPDNWREKLRILYTGKKANYKNPIERGKKISKAKKGIPNPNVRGEKNGIWIGGLPKCKECGKILSIYPSRSVTGYCASCWVKNCNRGEKCHLWKGGITPENNKIRHSLEYYIWRDEVWRRDYWTCRLCGHKDKDIVAHHLKLFSDFPELRFSIENGITLCRSCHKKTHKDIGKETRLKKYLGGK